MHFSFRRSASALVLLLALGGGMLAATTPGHAAEPPKGLAAPAKATPMPAFELTGIDGTRARSTDLRDKVAVFRFWATW